MSSGDYTSNRKMKQMYGLPVDNNIRNSGRIYSEHPPHTQIYGQPGCGGNYYYENQMVPIGYYPQQRPPSPPCAPCAPQQIQCINSFIQDLSLNYKDSVMTRTVKKYTITPMIGGVITFTVDKYLKNYIVDKSAYSQFVSVYSDSSMNIFFQGVVSNYDMQSGEITIGQVDGINGNFKNSSYYNVYLLYPDVILLKNRLNYIYQHLFQIDLNSLPSYNPITEHLDLYVTNLCQLFTYFFNIDLTKDAAFETIDDIYLNAKLLYLYQYFFNLDITKNVDFNPNGNEIKLNTSQNRIYQLYLYFFTVDMYNINNRYFNPNLIVFRI